MADHTATVSRHCQQGFLGLPLMRGLPRHVRRAHSVLLDCAAALKDAPHRIRTAIRCLPQGGIRGLPAETPDGRDNYPKAWSPDTDWSRRSCDSTRGAHCCRFRRASVRVGGKSPLERSIPTLGMNIHFHAGLSRCQAPYVAPPRKLENPSAWGGNRK